MAVSPFTVEIVCPQCGQPRQIGYYNRKQAIGRPCPSCRIKSSRRHGMTQTRVYHIWEGMRGRAGVTKSQDENRIRKYAHVGICDEWRVSFEAFRDWAAQNGYRDDLTIDRIDGTKGYEPGNCRWADYVAQNRNRKNVILNEAKVAEIKLLLLEGRQASEVARLYGVGKALIDGISAGRDWSDVPWPLVDPDTVSKRKHRLRAQLAAAWARAPDGRPHGGDLGMDASRARPKG